MMISEGKIRDGRDVLLLGARDSIQTHQACTSIYLPPPPPLLLPYLYHRGAI